MNKALILRLKKAFWFIGWVFIMAAVAGEFASVAHFLFLDKPFDLGPNIIVSSPPKQFDFFLNLKLFVKGMSAGFFCLLVSSVLKMISEGKGAKNFDRRLLKAVCIWFLADGVLGVWSWILNLSYIWGTASSDSLGITGLNLLTMLISGFDKVMPFLFALTIYILHRHFSKMISFESQVV